jgi:3-phytase
MLMALKLPRGVCALALTLATVTAARAQQPAEVPHVWTASGMTPAETDSLAAAATADGGVLIFATSKRGHCIDVLDGATGRKLRSFGRQGRAAGEFEYPNGVAIATFERAPAGGGSAGEPVSVLLVVERDNRRVQGLSVPGDKSIGLFGEGKLAKPYGVGVSQRGSRVRVYITDVGGPPTARVHVFDLELHDGALRAEWVSAFGEASGAGEIKEPESVVIDDRLGRVLLCDEDPTQKNVKVYTLDGKFTGQVFGGGLILGDPEGIVIVADARRDLVILTDQQKHLSTWHLFDRQTYRHYGAFTGVPTIANTDGICVWPHAFGPFKRGALFAVQDDAEVRAYDLAHILALPLE